MTTQQHLAPLLEQYNDNELIELVHSLRETIGDLRKDEFMETDNEEIWKATLRKAEQEAKKRGLL